MDKDKLVIYGAGKRGKKVYDILCKQGGVKPQYFCDRDAEMIQSIVIEGETVPVISYEELKKLDNCVVIIGIANGKAQEEISEKLAADGIKIINNIEEVLYADSKDIVANNRKYIADYHLCEMQDYFENAEDNLEIFWNEGSPFLKYFKRLDLSNVVELACGHGRHVGCYKERAGKIILVDILEENIEYCRKRFADEKKIEYYKNSGFDLCEIGDESQSALFTYDAMIHFELLDIFNYLKETCRILRKGGMALFHHSNNTENYKITFATATSGHNYMSKDLFAYLCNRAGLSIVEQKLIDWGGRSDLGCITLVKKEC